MWLFKIFPLTIRDSIRKKIIEIVNTSFVGDQIRNTFNDNEFVKNQQRIMIGQIESLHHQVQELKAQILLQNKELDRLNKQVNSMVDSQNQIKKSIDKILLKQQFTSQWLYRQSPQLMPLGLHELDLIKKFCIDHHIAPTLSTAISKNDIMFHYSLLYEKDYHRTIWGYLAVGFNGFDLIRSLISKYINHDASELKILDFASGHGRITRFLVNHYGPQHVFSSDIKPDAVQFHKDFFGIHSFVSSYSPSAVRCDERFSFIFAGSLFSHLPQNTFYSWLKVLSSWLKPGGVMAFTVHDMSLLGGDPQGSGFYFHPSNEDLIFPEIEGHLKDEQQYGISYVSELFVKQAVSEISSDIHFLERIPQGFGGLQDVYVIQKY